MGSNNFSKFHSFHLIFYSYCFIKIINKKYIAYQELRIHQRTSKICISTIERHHTSCLELTHGLCARSFGPFRPLSTRVSGVVCCSETFSWGSATGNISGFALDIINATVTLTFPFWRPVYSFFDVVGWHTVKPSIRGQQFILFSFWLSLLYL